MDIGYIVEKAICLVLLVFYGLMWMGNQSILVRTRAIVFDEEGKLLVQYHLGSNPDFYRLPGGGVRFGEKVEDCVIREVREESGLDVKVERLVWVRDFLNQFPYHSIEFFFLATVVGGEFRPSPEGENMELLFKSVEELGKVDFYPKILVAKLKLLRDDRDWREENPYIREAD